MIRPYVKKFVSKVVIEREKIEIGGSFFGSFGMKSSQTLELRRNISAKDQALPHNLLVYPKQGIIRTIGLDETNIAHCWYLYV